MIQKQLQTLLIDSGGTKAHWAFLAGQKLQAEGALAGIHPFFLTEVELEEKLRELSHSLPSPAVQEIFHYGTGTNSRANRDRLQHAYKAVFPGAKLWIDSDLLAVARALCGREAGIAAILGTGSNVGLYDGERLVKTAGGLGYVLGDEGSGAQLGRTLLNHYINRLLPPDLHEQLEQRYELSRESILEAVYRRPFPNRYLASVAPFLAEHLSVPVIRELVKGCFRDFFRLNILPLDAGPDLAVCCSGSVAYYFAAVLEETAAEFGVSIGRIAMSPMPGLVTYHTA